MDPLQAVSIITQDGEEHSLFGGGICRFVGLTGVGNPDVRRIEERTPLQHGVVDLGYRLEPRQMQLSLMIARESAADADVARDQISTIFSPHDLPLRLRVRRDDGAIRQIDCHVNGPIDFPTQDRQAGAQRVIVPLIANESPLWYEPTEYSTEASFSMGGASLSVAGSLMTWEEWPILEFVGPQTDPTIQWNHPTTIMYIVGTIASGETWRMDLRPRHKTFYRVSDGANRLGTVNITTIPAFSIMSIKPLKWLKAFNTVYTQSDFIVSATGTDSNSRIRIRYYRRFISL